MPEPRAIAVAAFIVSLALAALLWWLSVGSRRKDALQRWAMGSAMAGTGALLNVAQGDLHPVLTMPVGNSLMLAGLGCQVDGVRLLGGQRRRWSWVVPVAIMFPVSVVWGVLEPRLDIRVAVFSGLVVWLAAQLLLALRSMMRPGLRPGHVFVAMPAAVVMLLMAVRASKALAGDVQSVAIGGGVFNTMVYMVSTMMFVAMVIGLVLLHQLLGVEDLRADAQRDPLTGLLNRHALDVRLPADLAGCALVAVDVDRFKAINDGHGHAAGDRVLVFVGEVLSRHLRAGDLAIRMGGEEFAVLLPGVNQVQALAVAERLRSDLEQLSPAQVGLPVTASLGVALGLGGDCFAALWSRADAALYAAKRGGRNRVQCQPDPGGDA